MNQLSDRKATLGGILLPVMGHVAYSTCVSHLFLSQAPKKTSLKGAPVDPRDWGILQDDRQINIWVTRAAGWRAEETKRRGDARNEKSPWSPGYEDGKWTKDGSSLLFSLPEWRSVPLLTHILKWVWIGMQPHSTILQRFVGILKQIIWIHQPNKGFFLNSEPQPIYLTSGPVAKVSYIRGTNKLRDVSLFFFIWYIIAYLELWASIHVLCLLLSSPYFSTSVQFPLQ